MNIQNNNYNEIYNENNYNEIDLDENNLFPFFNNIDEQEMFIIFEEQLFININKQEPLDYDLQYFLVNQDYNKFWEWGIEYDLEHLIDLELVINLDYLYDNPQIENFIQIINIIENNHSNREIINILKTLSLKNRMRLYQLGYNRNIDNYIYNMP